MQKDILSVLPFCFREEARPPLHKGYVPSQFGGSFLPENYSTKEKKNQQFFVSFLKICGIITA